MSNLKETLIDMLKARGISIQDFCERANLGKNYIYELDINTPTLNKAVKIANLLNISLDFLVGRSNKEFQPKTRNCKLFLKNLTELLVQYKISKQKFYTDLTFSSSCFSRWRNGTLPYLRTIIEIADYLECSIDDLLI